MRFAIRFLSLVVLAVGLTSPACGRPDDGILPGVPFKDALTKEDPAARRVYNDPAGGGFSAAFGGLWGREIPIELDAKQSLTVTATVAGPPGRGVSLALLDPAGGVVAATVGGPKTAQLKVAQLASDGRHTLVVVSNQIGAFEVLATGPAPKEGDRKALEAKLRRLEAERKRLDAEIADVQRQLDKTPGEPIKRRP